MLFFRFFIDGSALKKVERFPLWASIQETDGPYSDRLIEEGRPLLRRLSFFVLNASVRIVEIGRHLRLTVHFPPVFRSSEYCLRKHRDDMPLDSRGSLAYFICVIGLENP